MIGPALKQRKLQAYNIINTLYTGSPIGSPLQLVTHSGEDLSVCENIEQQAQYCRGQEATIQSFWYCANKKKTLIIPFIPLNLAYQKLVRPIKTVSS